MSRKNNMIVAVIFGVLDLCAFYFMIWYSETYYDHPVYDLHLDVAWYVFPNCMIGCAIAVLLFGGAIHFLTEALEKGNVRMKMLNLVLLACMVGCKADTFKHQEITSETSITVTIVHVESVYMNVVKDAAQHVVGEVRQVVTQSFTISNDYTIVEFENGTRRKIDGVWGKVGDRFVIRPEQMFRVVMTASHSGPVKPKESE